jgi:Family of unknown function (DUF6544)
MRWIFGVVVVLHGFIHLLGAAKGLGLARATQLTQPIGTPLGVLWLAAAMLLVVAGVMLARATRGWWVVGAAAAATSQAVIVTSWTDAKAGTVVNLLLLVSAGYGFAARGPRSYRAEYRRRVDRALAEAHVGCPQVRVVTGADLDSLPAPVAAYVRQSGAVGKSGVVDFRARFHGRIRAGASKPWMSFTGEQVNTFGNSPSRLFRMDATLFGLPVDVLHVFVHLSASMRVKVCSLLPIVNASGPDMDRAETVTMLNDLCVFAPSALIDAPIAWQTFDDHRVRAAFTNGAHTVSAELVFNDEHELVNFISDDRARARTDGGHSTTERWSTPLSRYRAIGRRRVATRGEGRWHAPDPEGEYSYLEFNLDHIAYNTQTSSVPVPRLESVDQT